MIKAIKPKKCKNCRELFTPMKPLQSVCGFECAKAWGSKQTSKALNQDIRHRKLALKTKSDWLKEAQTVFNKFIRLRDDRLPCISCGRFHTGQYHAGHYRTVGSAPHLRFDEDNCHKQCAPCNNHLSGNIIPYRANLLRKIGVDNLEKIEADNTSKNYTIEQIKNIKQYYQLKVKELEGLKNVN